MTLEGWTTARNDERPGRFGADYISSPASRSRGGDPLAVCPRCLQADEATYVRRDWMIGWLAVCPRHLCILVTACPSCGRDVRLSGKAADDPVEIGRCHHCEASLETGASPRALDEVVALQRALIDIKRLGRGDVCGLGVVDWRSITAIADLVLQAVWRDAPDHARERLFAYVIHDFDMAPEERFAVEWTTNYGAFVLLAWLIANWSARLSLALALLNARSVDEILIGLADLNYEHRTQVRHLAGSALLHRRRRDGAGNWLRTVAKTGTDFRGLARRERHSGRKARLLALAMLQDGRTIDEAATRGGVKADTLKRWLSEGAAYGLNTIIAKPLRRCQLTSGQLNEIATWLASTGRATASASGWTPYQARKEIKDRFGLLISASEARRLLGRPPSDASG